MPAGGFDQAGLRQYVSPIEFVVFDRDTPQQGQQPRFSPEDEGIPNQADDGGDASFRVNRVRVPARPTQCEYAPRMALSLAIPQLVPTLHQRQVQERCPPWMGTCVNPPYRLTP